MYRNILLLVDSTESSAAAVQCAVSLAKLCGARLVALAVVDTETLKELLTYRIMVPEEMEEYERELEQSSARQLALAEEYARKAGVSLESRHMKGTVHSVVLAQREALHADLVIVSHFRPSVAKRDLLARSKQIILDEVPCAVLVVRKS